MRCYFAHPFSKNEVESKERIEAELKSRQLIVIDPFDDEQKIMDAFGVESYWGNESWELARRIWTKDLAWIPDYNVIGTAMEIAYAYEKNKFIQIISPIHHPSFAVYADQYFENIPDFCNHREYKWKRNGRGK